MSWRLLKRIKGEGWPEELLEMLYLEDDVKKWAVDDDMIRAIDEPTLDINGVAFAAGDSAIMTKDIFITGANFTAKRGKCQWKKKHFESCGKLWLHKSELATWHWNTLVKNTVLI